jgi:predicted DsbA family dithiol-disulfide isomerase
LARKYGTTVTGGQAMVRRMTEAAAGAGLEFHLERARPGNSFDAHRLLHLAAAHNRQHQVKERFLRAYLSEGEPIGDPDTVARLAVDAGLDPGEVRGILDSGKYADAVRADEKEALRLGVTSVPTFLIDRRLVVAGAQPAAELLGVLRRAWQMR